MKSIFRVELHNIKVDDLIQGIAGERRWLHLKLAFKTDFFDWTFDDL